MEGERREKERNEKGVCVREYKRWILEEVL